MNKNKSKLVKKYTRKDIQGMRKGGYHKNERGDAKTMRKNKKKEINLDLDEASVTSGVRGFLSNVKIKHSKLKNQKDPWYMSKEVLTSSLEEALTEWAFEQLLNEAETKEKEEVSVHKKAKPVSQKLFKDLFLKAEQVQKQGGPRTEEEAKILKFVQERGFELAKRSGATGEELQKMLKFSKRGKLSGQAEKSKNQFIDLLSNRAEAIKSKGGATNPQQEKMIQFAEKLQSDPKKLQNVFLRSFFSSFPEQLLAQAEQEFSKAGKSLNKPQRVQIWRLLQLPQMPLDLVLKYLNYFENREEEVIKANQEAAKSLAVAGPRGVRGLSVGSPEKFSSKTGEVSDEERVGNIELQDLEQEPEEVGGKGSFLSGEESGYNPMTDIFKTLQQTTQSRSMEDDLSDQGEVGEKEIEKFSGEEGKDIEHMSSEDAIKKMGPDEFLKIGSRVLLDKNGIYRNRALKIIANWISKDIKPVDAEHLNSVLDNSVFAKNAKDGSKYLAMVDPKDADPEVKDIYPVLYKAFNPESVLKTRKSLTGSTVAGSGQDLPSSPLVDYVKDKIAQIWNKKASQGQKSFEGEHIKKSKEEKEKESKKQKRSPEEMKDLMKQQELEKGQRAVRAHTSNLQKDNPLLAARIQAKQSKGQTIHPKDVQAMKLKQKLEDLSSGKLGGEFSPERKQKMMNIIHSRIRQLEMPMTTESLKKVFQRMLNGEENKLMEMLVSPENLKKEEEVETQEMGWDKGSPDTTKEFYPKSIQDWLKK